MSEMKTSQEYLARKSALNRYNPISKFSRRLHSHDRPVKTVENLLPPDEPNKQFTTKKRN